MKHLFILNDSPYGIERTFNGLRLATSLSNGLSVDPTVQVWQHRLTPVWKCIGGGCHLNRKIDDLVRPAGFHIVELKTTYVSGPKAMTFTYQGIACPA